MPEQLLPDVMAVAVLPSLDQFHALQVALQLVEHGWTQGAYWRNESGAHECSPRAARRVDLAHALELGAEEFGCEPEELRRLVLAQLGRPWSTDPVYGLERWNDQPLRTKTDVVFVLHRCLGLAAA